MADVEVSTRLLPGARAQSQISRQAPQSRQWSKSPQTKTQGARWTPVSGEPEEAEEL